MDRRLFLKALGAAMVLPSTLLSLVEKVEPRPKYLRWKSGFAPYDGPLTEEKLNRVYSEYVRNFARQIAEVEAKAFYS